MLTTKSINQGRWTWRIRFDSMQYPQNVYIGICNDSTTMSGSAALPVGMTCNGSNSGGTVINGGYFPVSSGQIVHFDLNLSTQQLTMKNESSSQQVTYQVPTGAWYPAVCWHYNGERMTYLGP